MQRTSDTESLAKKSKEERATNVYPSLRTIEANSLSRLWHELLMQIPRNFVLKTIRCGLTIVKSNAFNENNFLSFLQDVNFAIARFHETASTATESPSHSPWASRTNITPVSTFDGNLDDGNHSDLSRSPTLAR